MSKAFTRESDDAPVIPLRPRRITTLPPGTRNYLTASGAQRLREELHTSLHPERERLQQLAPTDDTKRELAAIADRIEQVEHTLSTAVIVEPPAPPHEQVRFGATVTARHRSGEETHYRIVGVDETDIDRDWISWLSPVAKALLNAQVGQKVRIKLPGGDDELTILAIRYE